VLGTATGFFAGAPALSGRDLLDSLLTLSQWCLPPPCFGYYLLVLLGGGSNVSAPGLE